MSTIPHSRYLQRVKKKMAPRSSRLEALEPRCVLAAPTLADLPTEINITAGAPVHLALGGHDADGDDLTYTVSSTNQNISASIPKQDNPNGNRSMRITVQGYGEMVFELFEGRAPNTTSRIIDIADSGWYENRIFHRVIDGFMIQGGSRDGLGINGTGTQFDDEFNADLQFTTSGLLAMAKSGDDTNDSQFFITDVPTGGFSFPRWLDFNHTIFGKLTAGDDVREAISQVATTPTPVLPTDPPADRPLQEIKITSVEIFPDNQNAVMMIAAPNGTFDSGDVTVTVSDGKGGTASKTIKVNVLPDTQNNTPFLGPIDPIRLTIDEPYSFQLDATDVEGDKIYYNAELLTDTNDVAVEVTEDGLVTITPKNEFVGVAEIAFRVGPTAESLVPNSDGEYPEATIDSQIVAVQIPPAKPTIRFAPGADTGAQDRITARDNSDGKELYFTVGNLRSTSQLSVFLDGAEVPYDQITRIPEGDGSANYVATIRVLTGSDLNDGDYTLHVQQLLPLGADYGNQSLASDVSDPFAFSVDTVPPVITSEAVDIAIQGEDYFYDVNSDDEGDPDLLYKIQAPIPDGMVINAQTGEIHWTPTADVGFEQPIVILAVDGAGNTGRQEFNITVYAPLEITFEGNASVDELETVSLIVTASDPSDLTSSLTITLQDGVLPANADYSVEPLEGNRAKFTWNTTEADGPGVYDLVFGATNGVNAMSTGTVRVTIAEANQAPELTQVFDQWTGAEDERIDLQFIAADNDLPANELVFDLFGDVPEGAVIDAASGLLSWTPDENDGGQSFQFGVRVTDSGGLSAEHTITINVAENQKAPVFDPTEAKEVVEGEVLDFVVKATDPDIPANAIQYELEGNIPSGLSIDPQTGRIRWEVPESFLPNTALESTVELTVVAREIVGENGVGQATKQTVEVTVVDRLADLIAATLTFEQTDISAPLAGPTSVTLVSTTSNANSESQPGTPMANSYDDRGFFGTQFGPIGTGGGMEPRSKKQSEDDGQTDPEPTEGDQTSVLEELLDEIAGDMGQSVFEALVTYAAEADSSRPEESPEAKSEQDPEPAQATTPSSEGQSEPEQPSESVPEAEVVSHEPVEPAAGDSPTS